MYDFKIIFPENRSHPLYPLCVWTCNDHKQLIRINFQKLSDTWGKTYVVWLKTILVLIPILKYLYVPMKYKNLMYDIKLYVKWI